jgi:tRNA modification GTPase
VAVDVRLALDHLGALVGETATEDILDALFDQFCIGK